MVRGAPLGLLALLLGCGEEVPPACAEMCEAATALYGACLEDWGADWSDAGYEDEADFHASCETWAWEMQLLEEDAVNRGEGDAEGATAAACAVRAEAMGAEDASCEDYSDIDWDTPPWRTE